MKAEPIGELKGDLGDNFAVLIPNGVVVAAGEKWRREDFTVFGVIAKLEELVD